MNIISFSDMKIIENKSFSFQIFSIDFLHKNKDRFGIWNKKNQPDYNYKSKNALVIIISKILVRYYLRKYFLYLYFWKLLLILNLKLIKLNNCEIF